MKRIYEALFHDHMLHHRQMLFVMGPRQVGKTTVAQNLVTNNSRGFYLNWDNINDRELIITGPKAIAQKIQIDRLASKKAFLVLDELHKFKLWRDFVKGLYDTYPEELQILVTGSARLDVFNRGGDSLMGRYFPFRFHPLTIAELTQSGANTTQEFWEEPKIIDDERFDALWQFGGYPDPFLKQSETFSRRWRNLRNQQLFNEEIRDLTHIQDIDRMELLGEKLKRQTGGLTSYQSLATQIRVSDNTIRNWLDVLKHLYFCFDLRPWSKNVARSLLKEPKYYLWDWSLCEDEGARLENMVAQHLLKAVHFWNDIGLGDYHLYFLRDKSQREVDFLISKNNTPWMIVEVKSSPNQGISKALHYFYESLKPTYAFQVVLNLEQTQQPCFTQHKPMMVPLKTFLSQLV